MFCAKRFSVGILNFVSIIFSMVDLKELKNERILLSVSLDIIAVSFFSCSVVTFACLSATSDSIYDEVSSPEANPLNDIVTVFSCYLLVYHVATKTQLGARL